MPKLWDETIEGHRRAVHDATLDATAMLVAEHGLMSVTMSRVAEATGIGRATLYKYFPDVESILFAWHERHVSSHLQHLAMVREHAAVRQQLEAVLQAYALISHERHDTELVALLHRGEHLIAAQKQLHAFVTELLTEGVKTGDVRDDAAPEDLATFCLHALTAASSMPSEAAICQLVQITLAGVRPNHYHPGPGA